MWNLKTNTNESIFKREIDSQTQKINLFLLPWWLSWQRICQKRRPMFDPGVEKIPWRWK